MRRKVEEAKLMATIERLPLSEWSDLAKGIGWIYFLHSPAAKAIKIGFSFEVEKRVRTLQTASPCPLILLGKLRGTEEEEREAHKKFKTKRLSGEWFKDCKRLRDFIADRVATP